MLSIALALCARPTYAKHLADPSNSLLRDIITSILHRSIFVIRLDNLS